MAKSRFWYKVKSGKPPRQVPGNRYGIGIRLLCDDHCVKTRINKLRKAPSSSEGAFFALGLIVIFHDFRSAISVSHEQDSLALDE